ncbi:MAG: hypothetical protein HPY53_14310 [Brevinematales bacterium]|nr:hypothetical protein [Brevinematales bacterium]
MSECPFYNGRMENMPKMAESMKKIFCKLDNSQCARYMVSAALGTNHIPHDLYPEQFECAQKIILQQTKPSATPVVPQE